MQRWNNIFVVEGYSVGALWSGGSIENWLKNRIARLVVDGRDIIFRKDIWVNG